MSGNQKLFIFAVVLCFGAWHAPVSGGAQERGGPVVGEKDPTVPSGKLSASLLRRLAEDGGAVKAWVFFRDKGLSTPEEVQAALQRVAESYNVRAVQRRALRGNNAARGGALFDEHDLPLGTGYVEAVVATGAKLHVESTWLNAISVWATREQAELIATLPFVDRLEAVRRTRPNRPLNVQDVGPGPLAGDGETRLVDYGYATAQLTQINLIALHNAGYTGEGVVIGILDTGFQRSHVAFNNPSHPLQVLAEYDFVDGDGNTQIEPGDPSGQHTHGTMILGCIGAYQPGSLVGGAYDAAFVLCKTEDTTQEVPAEEDDFVAGLQFTEAHGVDMTTASLGYIDWYTQAQLDGETAVTTIACNIHTGNGVHHTNAAGNEYHDSNPTTSHLIAPADAFQVITCGAVDSSGAIASFSSDGPTADGRVKPEVLARGISTYTVSPSSDTGYTTADGTSLSTPLVACAVACLIEAKPYWTVDQMRTHLFEKCDYYVQHGTFDPLYVLGYGILDALATSQACDDAGSLILDAVKYNCADTVQVLLNDCGPNVNSGAIDVAMVTVSSQSEPAGEPVTLTELAPDAAEFLGSIAVSTTDAPGVLLVAPGDTLTVTYIDADNGQGQQVTVTATAPIDCTPPTISNVRVTKLLARAATIAMNTDEPARGIVHYGLSCDALNWTAEGTEYTAFPFVELTGLTDGTTYYYRVEAEDQAGNVGSDPTCRSFTTVDVPNFFTQLFTNDNDLDYRSLIFLPNGSLDYYFACGPAASTLPTDPAGGTTLSLGNDSYANVSLSGGATVPLYGVSYNHFYVGSNGYITFNTGDSTSSESLAAHFSQPRISALFDDLNPPAGGSVSWKQLVDRVAVTWLNIREAGTSTANTFQIELYFNGQITITYLAIAAADGLAGLSDGSGIDPDYFPTDLSGLGSCDTHPPTAYPVSASVPEGGAGNVTLAAQDEGLPNPPSALTFVIVSLPAYGVLSDPGAGAINAVPYTLVNGGRVVTYAPHPQFVGEDVFEFLANDGGQPPDGGDSNVAPATITVTPVPELVYSFPMDADPGWTTEGAWAFGQPTGDGSHAQDPTAGHTGVNVYGYNLNGDYVNNLPARHLRTTALDCTHVTQAELRFWRWLGVEVWDRAAVEVSGDGGATWTTLWENSLNVNDAAWVRQTFDISAAVDGAPNAMIRWAMGPTDYSVTYPGWNVDDVEIWGVLPAPALPGDLNCDYVVDLRDINAFVLYVTDCAAWQAQHPDCALECGDVDGDGLHACNGHAFDDINAFVALLSGK